MFEHTRRHRIHCHNEITRAPVMMTPSNTPDSRRTTGCLCCLARVDHKEAGSWQAGPAWRGCPGKASRHLRRLPGPAPLAAKSRRQPRRGRGPRAAAPAGRGARPGAARQRPATRGAGLARGRRPAGRADVVNRLASA